MPYGTQPVRRHSGPRRLSDPRDLPTTGGTGDRLPREPHHRRGVSSDTSGSLAFDVSSPEFSETPPVSATEGEDDEEDDVVPTEVVLAPSALPVRSKPYYRSPRLTAYSDVQETDLVDMDLESSFSYRGMARFRSSSGGARSSFTDLPPPTSSCGVFGTSLFGHGPSPPRVPGGAGIAAGDPGFMPAIGLSSANRSRVSSADALPAGAGTMPLGTAASAAVGGKGDGSAAGAGASGSSGGGDKGGGDKGGKGGGGGGGNGGGGGGRNRRRLPSAHTLAQRKRGRMLRRTVYCLMAMLLLTSLVPVVFIISGFGNPMCPNQNANPRWSAVGPFPRRECSATRVLRDRALPVAWKADFAIFKDYHRPTTNVQDAGIVVSTQLTLDRLARLHRLATLWRGPISASVFLCSSTEVAMLDAALESSPLLKKYVAVQVVVGHSDYLPINMLRNIAAHNAESMAEWLVVLDVDNLPSHPMPVVRREVLRAARDVTVAGGDLNRTTFILPALEATGDDIPVDVALNVSKSELVTAWRAGSVQTMHPYNPESYHGPFDIGVWLFRDRQYEVQYERKFESYFISRRPIVPFDERFVGRRRNKQSQWFEMWAAGYRFWLLPHTWVVDTPHTSGIHTERAELMYARKWAAFLSEVTAKYDLKCTRPKRDCWWIKENLEHHLGIVENLRKFQMQLFCGV